MVFKKIFSLSRKLHRSFNDTLKDTGLGSGQIFILLSVIENPGINQDTLCRKLDLDKSTVTKGMKTLLDDKYIIRLRDKKDMRNWILFPSKKGEGMSKKINIKIKNFELKILNKLEAEEIVLLKRIISKIEENTLL